MWYYCIFGLGFTHAHIFHNFSTFVGICKIEKKRRKNTCLSRSTVLQSTLFRLFRAAELSLYYERVTSLEIVSRPLRQTFSTGIPNGDVGYLPARHREMEILQFWNCGEYKTTTNECDKRLFVDVLPLVTVCVGVQQWARKKNTHFSFEVNSIQFYFGYQRGSKGQSSSISAPNICSIYFCCVGWREVGHHSTHHDMNSYQTNIGLSNKWICHVKYWYFFRPFEQNYLINKTYHVIYGMTISKHFRDVQAQRQR